MSTILKALRRLEEDRRGDVEGDLRDAVTASPAAPGRRGRGSAWAGGALAGAGVVLVGAALWSALLRSPAEEAAPQVAAPGPVAPAARVAALAPLIPEPSPEPEIARPPLPRPPPRSVSARPPLREASPEPLERPPPDLEPLIHRAPVPDLVVSSTTWHPSADRRLAILRVAGRDQPVQLREGDAVGPLVLLEIRPTGVVFLHDGIQVSRPVGEIR